jgi:uncharacterized protein YycO
MRRLFLATVIASLPIYGAYHLPETNEGDIIFQTSRSSQSSAIQRATNSTYSHMGVVLYRKGRPFVFEAVATVRYTPLNKWIARGKDSHFVLKRLVHASSTLTPANIVRLRSVARTFEGKPYDLTFEWSDSRIYCSELVWKLYQRALGIEIGQQHHLKDFNLTDPVVLAKLRERYGKQIPLSEPVISPVAMFNSSLLQMVTSQ